MDRSSNSKFMRNLVISYSTILLIIFLMGVNLYNLSIKNVGNEIRNQNMLILQNSVKTLDRKFRTMDALAGQVATNSNIIHLANKEDNTDKDFYLLALNAKNDLAVFLPTQNMLPIETYFIYLQQPGYILSFSQFEDTSIYYTGKQNYKAELYVDWLNMMNNQQNYRQLIPIETYKDTVSPNYLYILYLKNFSLRNIPATICFEIDKVKLEDIFSEINFFDTGYLFAADSKGNKAFQITHEKTSEINPDILKELEFDNSFSSYHDGKQEMFITRVESDYNNWTYYLVQPADASLYSLEQYRNVFIITILIAIGLGFLLIVLLSRTNVKPIILLDNQLKDTITKQKTLEEVIKTQKPIIQRSYLQRIMEGSISSNQELDYAVQYLDFNVEDQRFSVLYVNTYVNQYEISVDNSVVISPETDDYRQVIIDAFYKYIDDHLFVLQASEQGYALLLSSPLKVDKVTSTNEVKKKFTQLHDYLLENHSIWTVAGLGNWNDDLMVTWKSYQQASQAVNYTSRKKLFVKYSTLKRDTNQYYYPMEIAMQLTNFIKSGNESQILEIFKVINYENTVVRDLPINMMRYLLSDIRNTLLKIRFDIELTEDNSKLLSKIDDSFNKPRSLTLCEDIAIDLCSIFDVKTSNNEIISNIKDYIQENYQDPSISLTKISTEFSISESYFSYLFKEETGENFSVYLESIRMKEALRLLDTTNIPISDLYEEVGYNNSNTFRRVFKKTYGVSPKVMREQLQSDK
ncbi:MAG: helix-turn-helix transcriptional regulator [Clostridiales bacterium]|nr:helix-turn-helix transcriptional regulator [Clostridiales bacterium]